MLTSTLVSGPDASRRFGRAVRVNLVGGPATVCSYHCAYCRSPETALRQDGDWPSPTAIVDQLTRAIADNPGVDTIVIGGNGEPTGHPAFAEIVDRVIAVRNAVVPAVKVAIVSNGSTLDRIEVRHALSSADVRLMKLDAGDATTFRVLSGACVSLGRLLGQLRYLGRVTLLARFVRNADRSVDNTGAAALDAWLDAVAGIQPASVQISGSDWESHEALEEVPHAELLAIAARVERLGIPAAVV